MSVERKVLLIALCPTCNQYTTQEGEVGDQSCFICHTPYVNNNK